MSRPVAPRWIPSLILGKNVIQNIARLFSGHIIKEWLTKPQTHPAPVHQPSSSLICCRTTTHREQTLI